MELCARRNIGFGREILIKEIIELFKKHFGRDEKELALFRKWLKLANKKYGDDELTIEVARIMDEGYNKALDLGRYISARIFELNGNKKMNYEEALELIGLRRLKIGSALYHFSNINHGMGFEGHRGMCLSDSSDFGEVVANIDIEKEVYRHICDIRNPKSIIDHDARTIAKTYSAGRMGIGDIIREFIFNERGARWYELEESGAIRVIKVEKVR
ncbi:MAG: hypothetical protein N3D20_01130 [Candidatus Pacearchaeota archaeon]|nr:hypothetical protein [Candidatus Pacearchaeota archaeon]